MLIHVPAEKQYTSNVNVADMRVISREVEAIHREALQENYWTAMTLNGIVYSAVLNFNPKIAIKAISKRKNPPEKTYLKTCQAYLIKT